MSCDPNLRLASKPFFYENPINMILYLLKVHLKHDPLPTPTLMGFNLFVSNENQIENVTTLNKTLVDLEMVSPNIGVVTTIR